MTVLVAVPVLAAPHVTPGSVFALYFGWPEGAVYGNLVASAICAALVWWRLRARMIAHHLEQMQQRARLHAAHLAAAERLHAELKEHVTATVTAAARQQKRLAPRTPARPGGDLE